MLPHEGLFSNLLAWKHVLADLCRQKKCNRKKKVSTVGSDGDRNVAFFHGISYVNRYLQIGYLYTTLYSKIGK